MCVNAAILTSVLAFPAASGWLWGLVSALLLNKQQLYFHMDHCHESSDDGSADSPGEKMGKLICTLILPVNIKVS